MTGPEHFEFERFNNRRGLRESAPTGPVTPLSDDAQRAVELLNGLAAIVRASMPGVVRKAFIGQLMDLRDVVGKPAQRDVFTRGVWAGYNHLLTELINRLNVPDEPPIANLDKLAQEPPGFA